MIARMSSDLSETKILSGMVNRFKRHHRLENAHDAGLGASNRLFDRGAVGGDGDQRA